MLILNSRPPINVDTFLPCTVKRFPDTEEIFSPAREMGERGETKSVENFTSR
jgi:hypothetical protein